MAAETGFLIEGTVYEVPTLDSLTTDEEQVMYDRCGVVQEDFLPLEGETEEDNDQRIAGVMRAPGFMVALMHIAYQRGNPTVKEDQVRVVIGKTKRLEALSTLGSTAEAEEDEVVPLALTSEHNDTSARSSLESDKSTRPSPASSGSVATNGLDKEDDGHANTGTMKSATFSISDPEISAA